MNAREVFELAVELERARTPFALATVVERHAPVSSHLGDRAIVFADGRMEGFVGGSCSRDIVRRQAVDAMHAGNARLVRDRRKLRLGRRGRRLHRATPSRSNVTRRGLHAGGR